LVRVTTPCRDIIGVDLERLLESGSRRIIVVFGKRLQVVSCLDVAR
jgi:hypothetical protein